MDIPPKLWFQLQRLRAWWHGTVQANEPLPAAAHRMCPNCRALVDRDSSVCPLCGVSLRHARAASSRPGRVMGLPIPSTATSVLVAANIALYGVSWYLTSTGAFQDLGGSSSGMLGNISTRVLVALGAKYGPLIYAGQWWRLVTACFLHAGLLHIGFNLWCLVDLGPEVESLFPVQKYIVMYLVTGVSGFLLSLWWSPFVPSMGASAPVLGLIGVLIGATYHHGSLGKQYRSQLWRWIIYIFVLGLFFAVDNAAHLGGLVTGLALGYFVPEGEPATRSSETLWSTLSTVSILIIVGSFVLMALQLNQPLR